MGGTWGAVLGSTGRRAPFAPEFPTVSSPNANQDIVSWVAPINGGSPITLYYWESDDGKSGTTVTTSVTVNQEAGTSQTYRVRAENAVGLGEWSSPSIQITTTFSFAPFGFSPAPFTCPSSCSCCSCTSGTCYCSYCYINTGSACYCDD